jgi:hypothetical protein
MRANTISSVQMRLTTGAGICFSAEKRSPYATSPDIRAGYWAKAKARGVRFAKSDQLPKRVLPAIRIKPPNR